MTREILKPMLATLVDEAFDDPSWVFEIKFDGYRLIAEVHGGKVTLFSRNAINVTTHYPTIAKAISQAKGHVIFDGEIVALDRKGISRFELMQRARESGAALYYYVFDLLYHDGKDLRTLPLLSRKALLKKILPKSRYIRYSDHIECKGKKFFTVASKRGLEGIIAKRKEGRYYSNKRTREWLKIKCMHEQEAVVIGFTKPRASRKYFGSLVLAVHERGKLVYVGHSGGGFDQKTLKSLHGALLKLRSNKPITEKIPREKDVTWVKPEVVCEVKFTEWTSSGQMRHPIFLGLRTDTPARKVTREIPVSKKIV